MFIRSTTFVWLLAAAPALVCAAHAPAGALVLDRGEVSEPVPDTGAAPAIGSAIFVHADGASVSHWAAARLLTVGPDGEMAWDRLPRIGIYRGHLSNSLGSSSHGGATAHAFGVKVSFDSYGMWGDRPLRSLSGATESILMEASAAGLSTALVNSGHLAEPGTGVFAASAPSRSHTDAITRQIVESGVDIILGGGEVLLLPEGVTGRFGYRGVREDTVNLIARARQLGYEVVYSRDELEALPDNTRRVLGMFAPGPTFNDRSEEVLAERGLPHYASRAPTVAEMTAKALRMLQTRESRFLLVVEEEGSDNFANQNNASGTLEALARADAALAEALDYVDRNPATLLLTAADSDAGGLQVWPVRNPAAAGRPLPPVTDNGAPLDGVTGSGGMPFVAQADAAGERLLFGIAWAASDDLLGGIVARAHGLNADLLPATVDNTDIYRMLYATLFGRWLP